MAITTFHETLERLSETTGRGMAELVAMYERGQLDRARLASMGASMLETAAIQGATYGQIAYTQYAAEISGREPATLFSSRQATENNQREIVRKSVNTVMGGPDETLSPRLIQVGENLPIQAVQDSYGAALRSDQLVEGWTRGLDPTACELCVWWWREGRVWPKDHAMPTHTGCKCQQIPTFVAGGIADTAQSRLRRERRKAEEYRAMSTEERIETVRRELAAEGLEL